MSNKHGLTATRLEYLAQLHRAVHAVGLFIDSRFGSDVSQAEALVLVQLFTHGASTINDVHQTFLHRRSTLTSVLDRLEAKGYVSREAAPDDRRSVRLTLTRSGRELASEIAAAFEKTCAGVGSGKALESASTLLDDTAAAFAHACEP